jgi:hypothetical protein
MTQRLPFCNLYQENKPPPPLNLTMQSSPTMGEAVMFKPPMVSLAEAPKRFAFSMHLIRYVQPVRIYQGSKLCNRHNGFEEKRQGRASAQENLQGIDEEIKR